MEDLLFVRDPKNRFRMMTEPWAERSWFSESSLRVLARSKKTVPEWASVFQVARSAAWDGQVPPEDLYPEEDSELFKNFESSTKNMSEPVPSYEDSVARGLLQEESEERAAWGDGAKSPGKTSRSPSPPRIHQAS
jgi:hypothetical protein